MHECYVQVPTVIMKHFLAKFVRASNCECQVGNSVLTSTLEIAVKSIVHCWSRIEVEVLRFVQATKDDEVEKALKAIFWPKQR